MAFKSVPTLAKSATIARLFFTNWRPKMKKKKTGTVTVAELHQILDEVIRNGDDQAKMLIASAIKGTAAACGVTLEEIRGSKANRFVQRRTKGPATKGGVQ